MRWNQITPRDRLVGDTPTPGRIKTKWDETPLRNAVNVQQTPTGLNGATPTPQGAYNMPTPSPGVIFCFFFFIIKFLENILLAFLLSFFILII